MLDDGLAQLLRILFKILYDAQLPLSNVHRKLICLCSDYASSVSVLEKAIGRIAGLE